MDSLLPPLTTKLIKALEHISPDPIGEKISVNPIVSEVASFYENIRNAMEYQEEEVVFRSAIERILKRRLLLDGTGEKVAEPLLKELAWAKYFPNGSVPHSIINEIKRKIDLYVDLYREVSQKHKAEKGKIYDWILQVLSADIAFTIKPNKEAEVISNFMFHILQKKITILDDDIEEKDAIIFVNIKRALSKEDHAFLRYHLFLQYFGKLTEGNLTKISNEFLKGYQTIEKTFSHPLNYQIYTFIKKRAVPFVILKDVFDSYRDQTQELIYDQEKLGLAVLKTCDKRYQEISRKVKTAILRSVIFLFATKAVFALLIEGTFENYIYGQIFWGSLILNMITPSLLMFSMLFFIKIPSKENSVKILERIRSILFDPEVSAIKSQTFELHSKTNPLLLGVFTILWFAALALGIVGIHLVLNFFKVNLISQGIFIFFILIVSFLTFRISQSAKTYNVGGEREGFRTILSDFFFMPFIQLGRRITLSFASINVFLMLFDFIIETPFKTLFAFFETWFSFLRSQRERLE